MLNGGAGDDLLKAGLGKDKMTGGAGNDQFDFTELGANNGSSSLTAIKTISDFVSGSDKLVFAANRFDNATLSGKYVENLAAAASLYALKMAATVAHDAGAQYYFGVLGNDGYLFADDTGDGWGDVIKLAGKTDMAATDITLHGSTGGSQAGAAVIDLGSYGKLTAPVQVEGKWYYYWDLNGDGSLNGSLDHVTHDVLDNIFTQDINGNLNPDSNTTDVYRYATLNGVKLALPTANGGMIYPNGIDNFQPGTSIHDGATINPVYDDLLAIWDAYNGAGTETDIPAGGLGNWLGYIFWSATPSALGHTCIFFNEGYVLDNYDFSAISVALQVL